MPAVFAMPPMLAALCAAVLLALAAPPSPAVAGSQSRASSSAPVLKKGMRGPAVRELQHRLRVRTTGYFGTQTQRAVRRFQRRRGLTVDGVVGPRTRAALGLRGRAAAGSGSDPGTPVRLPARLRRIAQCESGGNPRAVSPDGRYRGKYQFSRATWRALGGKGDPARARETDQDRRALTLYRREGTKPWPACSASA